MYSKKIRHIAFCKPFGYLLTFALILPCLTLVTSASNVVYEEAYNIYYAVAYAEQYAYNYNDEYPIAYATKETPEGKQRVEEDCTDFTSQCLVAGGIPMSEGWTSDSSYSIFGGYKDGYNTFVNAGLFNQYCANQGYLIEKSVTTEGNALSINRLVPAVGDIVQFDWEGDGRIDHSMICCGFSNNGEPCFAGHTNSAFMLPFSQIKSVQTITYLPATNSFSGTITYLIHMTDTIGLTDITSRYVDGTVVAIRSLATNQYVSADTDAPVSGVNAVANRTTASTWELYTVETNRYGDVGYRALSNGNYLSARVDMNSRSAPIQAAHGKDYVEPQSWESFRVYERDGIQYIQSQANGKWVQVNLDNNAHTVQASGRTASIWEQFEIEVISTPATVDVPVSNAPTQNVSVSSVANAVAPTTNQVNQQRYGSGYNEGEYSGEWSNGLPNGKGKLEYKDFNGDGLFYTISFDTQSYKALYYEGNFLNGARDGEGVVVFEGGYKAEGTYYGAWEAGKTVFDGKLWYPNGSYLECRMIATSTIAANWVSR